MYALQRAAPRAQGEEEPHSWIWAALVSLAVNFTGLSHWLRGDYEMAVACALSLNLIGLGALLDYLPFAFIWVDRFCARVNILIAWLGFAVRLDAMQLGKPVMRDLYVLAACTYTSMVLPVHERQHAAVLLWGAGYMPVWALFLAIFSDAPLDFAPPCFIIYHRGLWLSAWAGLALCRYLQPLHPGLSLFCLSYLFKRNPPGKKKALAAVAFAAGLWAVALTHTSRWPTLRFRPR